MNALQSVDLPNSHGWSFYIEQPAVNVKVRL